MSAEEHLVPAHGHDQCLDSCDKEQVHYENSPVDKINPFSSQPQLLSSPSEDTLSLFTFGESCFIAEHSSEERIESADTTLHKPTVHENIPVDKSQEPLGNILQSINQLGVHSGNSGSDFSSSEDLSSCHSDELDAAPTPCASQTPKRNYSLSDGKYSANNEVVCGHEHSMIPVKDHRLSVPNVSVHQILPEEQMVPSSGSLLVSNDKWPPELREEEEQDDAAMDIDDNLKVSSETYPRSDGSCHTKGKMVIGCPESSLTHLRRLSADVIADPHHFVEKGIESVGKTLNHIVSDMHHSPRSDVKFHTRKKTSVKKEKCRCMWETEDVPVLDPSDSLQCPEAFEGRNVLRHMRRGSNFHEYAALLDYRDPREFKSGIDQVLGRIPGRRNPLMTWDILFDTLSRMKNFLLNATDGLERTNKHILATKIKNGMEDLDDIIENANQAQELSSLLTK